MRLIDADELIKKMQAWHEAIEKAYGCNDGYVQGYGAALDVVENAPTVGKCEGERGRWVAVSRRTMLGWNLDFPGRDPTVSYVCSACETEAIFNRNGEGVLSKYCPHCGAKMWNEEGAK